LHAARKNLISSKNQERMQKGKEAEEEEYIGKNKCETQDVWILSLV